jgi:prephenate dehydrogenase
MLAYTLVNLLAIQQEDENACFDLAAGGFYDITRIASSDPIMWRDICLQNERELIGRLGEFQEMIDELAELIRAKDSDGLERVFRDARHARSRISGRRLTPNCN